MNIVFHNIHITSYSLQILFSRSTLDLQKQPISTFKGKLPDLSLANILKPMEHYLVCLVTFSL